ncbi:NUDIX domain-containing protein [Gluconobacter cerinus]|uniref:NUDIX hydrolase n=1 Tax=Gluconobacter cerinus TaxID=38307 RepID=UPI00193F828C|nr:NUDIX domain-containing protein [Gluconobacter cerinus]MBM3097383.1 NUDIX domain-containing protein [Gluconobacter cerinus]
MRQRPAARLLVLDQQDRVLLFRFFHSSGALAGRSYWSTPGGSLKDGENFVQAAKRELHEETGLNAPFLSSEIGQRTFVLMLASGETVLADERFFALRAPETTLSSSGWTPNEKNVLKGHHWWSRRELEQTAEIIFPERLLDLLTTALSGHLP